MHGIDTSSCGQPQRDSHLFSCPYVRCKRQARAMRRSQPRRSVVGLHEPVWAAWSQGKAVKVRAS
eukprot:363291-Chlamydomonas_euryale.AAC.14